MPKGFGDDLHEVSAVEAGQVTYLRAAGEPVSKDAPVGIGACLGEDAIMCDFSGDSVMPLFYTKIASYTAALRWDLDVASHGFEECLVSVISSDRVLVTVWLDQEPLDCPRRCPADEGDELGDGLDRAGQFGGARTVGKELQKVGAECRDTAGVDAGDGPAVPEVWN
ncbi:hypothetical protein ACIQPS_36640 [Streptomyces sp. NPDC091290]|uniref:hypothetical protein n=1 Tax=Streptomyces sp. NPDC091290 TaxID=3365990 RepID=UPI00382293FE